MQPVDLPDNARQPESDFHTVRSFIDINRELKQITVPGNLLFLTYSTILSIRPPSSVDLQYAQDWPHQPGPS